MYARPRRGLMGVRFKAPKSGVEVAGGGVFSESSGLLWESRAWGHLHFLDASGVHGEDCR